MGFYRTIKFYSTRIKILNFLKIKINSKISSKNIKYVL